MLVLLLAVGALATFMAITKDRVEAGPPRQAEPTNVHANIGESSGAPSASASGSPTPTDASTTTTAATTPPSRASQQPAVTTTSAKPTPGPGQLYVPNLIGRIGAEADYLLRSVGLVPKHVGDGSWALCPVLTQDPEEGTIVDLDSTVTFTTQPDDGSGC